MASPSALLAFGFVHWAMLGWLAAAAVPLVIHLWNRRQQRDTDWAAIEFLLAALRKNARRLQLEQWLLLAMRTLLLVLLACAVAEPFFEQTGMLAPSSAHTHKLFVIDGSFSMAYRPTDRNRFERAKELIEEIVDGSPRGDGFSLLMMSQPARIVVGTPALDPEDFFNELDGLSLPHTGGDVAGTLERVATTIELARREHPRLQRTEVYFLTDLGRATWLPQDMSAEQMASVRGQAQAISERAGIVLLDVGQTQADNLAIEQFTTGGNLVTMQQAVRLEAQIRNYGRQAQTRKRVEFLVDGVSVNEKFLDLEPGQSAGVVLDYRFETPGDHTVECRLAGDLLDVDNHRWRVLPVRETIRVLCIDGHPAGDPLAGAAGYLAVALAPAEDRFSSHPIAPVVVPETALLESDLSEFDCIFLSNVSRVTAAEAEVLSRYLDAGGGLVVFLGDRVQTDNYNRFLGAEEDGAGILPARLAEVVSESQYQIDPLEYRHPIVAAFRGQERAGLLTTPVRRYVRLELDDDSTSEVAVAFGSGDPFIVEARRDRGRCLLVATSADTSWTAMPLWPSFVPLVQELLAVAVQGQQDGRNLTVGGAISDELSRDSAGDTLEIRTPSDKTAQLSPSSSQGVERFRFDDTLNSGIYSVASASTDSAPRHYAVNVDTAESDLSPLDVQELRADLWQGVAFQHLTTWQNLEDQPVVDAPRRGRLHRGLLYVVLSLLLAEPVVAWYLGRRSA